MGALTALALAVVLAAGVLVVPLASRDTRPDAVVVLAGDPDARLPVAVDLARRGSGVLAVSVPERRLNARAQALCDDPGGLTVHCFEPNPRDTGGEAQAIGRMVAEHGWERITVVTSTYHVPRAAVLVGRCTDATVHMVGARSALSLAGWRRVTTRELGGLAVAAVRPSC